MIRPVVVHAPSPGDVDAPRLPIGAVRWRLGGQPRLTLIVKATFALSSDDPLSFDDDQEPLAVEEIVDGVVETVSDFAPRKAHGEVIVVGEVFAPRPTKRLTASLRVGAVTAEAIVDVTEPTDHAGFPFAPRATDTRSPIAHPRDFDFVGYQTAAPALRGSFFSPRCAVELTGLSRRTPEIRTHLPPIVPRVFTDDAEIPLVCDTIVVDSAQQIVVVGWRGDIVDRGDDRYLVALDHADALRSEEELRRSIVRGATYTVAVEPAALDVAPTPEESARIEIAKWEAWEHAPEPETSLQEFARISAEVAEGDAPRARVLERHRRTENDWSLEERAWLEKMAKQAEEGDGTLAVDFGESFVAAQDRLGTPAEAQRGVKEYATLSAALDAGARPDRLLAERGMTLASWMRLDRRMQREMAVSPPLREAFEKHYAEAPREVPFDDDEVPGSEETPS